MIYKQRDCKALGEEGCYFLSLLWIAERELGRDLDALAVFDEAKKRGWAGTDCYMANPAAMMTELLGKPCEIRKSWDFSETLKENEREVRCYRRETTGTTYYHFVAVSEEGVVVYDPLEDSNTVRLGKPHSRRILTIG